MTKCIPLSQDKTAIVNDSDYEWLNQWKWSATRGHKTFYAVRGEAVAPYKRRLIQMHRQILGEPPFDKAEADHINGDGLDNRRENLRWCSHKENRRNEPKRLSGKNRFKGTSRRKHHAKPWRAQIKVNGKQIHLGHFADDIDAAKAYNEAAIKYHGEFACLNDV